MIHNTSLTRAGSPCWLVVELGGESFASVIEKLKLEMCRRTITFTGTHFRLWGTEVNNPETASTAIQSEARTDCHSHSILVDICQPAGNS